MEQIHVRNKMATSIIKHMLILDSDKRPEFRELLSCLPDRLTFSNYFH